MTNEEMTATWRLLDRKCKEATRVMADAATARAKFQQEHMAGWAIWTPEGPHPSDRNKLVVRPVQMIPIRSWLPARRCCRR